MSNSLLFCFIEAYILMPISVNNPSDDIDFIFFKLINRVFRISSEVYQLIFVKYFSISFFMNINTPIPAALNMQLLFKNLAFTPRKNQSNRPPRPFIRRVPKHKLPGQRLNLILLHALFKITIHNDLHSLPDDLRPQPLPLLPIGLDHNHLARGFIRHLLHLLLRRLVPIVRAGLPRQLLRLLHLLLLRQPPLFLPLALGLVLRFHPGFCARG
mmetsp:Transcript_13371/g.15498  ORF Transcript_13371/g.15498 Transcript_13371/m.15498 type:complete len:213 (+) Transcript_13371:306-944(+)